MILLVLKNTGGATESSPCKWQEDVCWGLRETTSPLLLPPGVGMKLRPWEQMLSLLAGAAMEEPRAVSKQPWNLLHNPHSDVSPRSSGSCGQYMKSSLKFWGGKKTKKNKFDF